MSSFARIFAVLAVSLSLASCASLITGGPLLRPGEPVGALQIVNASNRTLTVVMISDCNAASYGLNRLPSGTVIRPGQSYQFRVSQGCWDVSTGLGTGNGSWAESRFRTRVTGGRVTSHRIVG